MKHLLLSLAVLASMHAGLMHAQQLPQSPLSHNRYAMPGNAAGLPYGHAGLYNSSSATSPFASPPMMLPAARPVAVAIAMQGVHAHAASEATGYRRLHVQPKKDSPESQRNMQPTYTHQTQPFEEHIVYADREAEQDPGHMGYAMGTEVRYIQDPVSPKADSAPASLVQAAYVQPAASAQRQAAQSNQAPKAPAPITCCTIL